MYKRKSDINKDGVSERETGGERDTHIEREREREREREKLDIIYELDIYKAIHIKIPTVYKHLLHVL